jgi:hypothetical protein
MIGFFQILRPAKNVIWEKRFNFAVVIQLYSSLNGKVEGGHRKDKVVSAGYKLIKSLP